MNRLSFVLSCLFALGMASCAGSDGLPIDEPQDQADDAKYDSSCIHRGKSCKTGGPHCCTGFCSESGYGYSYSYSAGGTCTAPLANGSYCTADNWCASKHCSDYACAAKSCAAAGTKCARDTDCCVGSCDPNAYSPTWLTCVAPQADGTYCITDRDCQSGHCRDYACAQ